ncbi:MAG TPA: DNA-processing protein DprA [Novosphingobium sp.]|nr:DNA-processing protein DprA [Novosphingobium sp.]
MSNPGLTRAEGIARLRLWRSAGVGGATYLQLLGEHGSAQAALAALPAIMADGGKRWAAAPAEQIEAEMAAVRAAGARYIFHDSPDYPPMLALAAGAPPILMARGRIELAWLPAVALVGARNASAAGMQIARDMARDLSGQGYAVVSGLARGIDAAAHVGAMAAHEGAGTVAVLPGGIDSAYPPEHAALMDEIAGSGLLLAVAPPGTAPTTGHFHARNRVIASLSLGVVVVEAAARSGALATARAAVEDGREVMAVPGSPLDARCHGSNRLIHDGALLVQDAQDVIEQVAPLIGGMPAMPARPVAPVRPVAPARAAVPAAPTAQALPDRIVALLGVAPVAVDEILRQCGASADAVQQALVDLELDGLVVRHAGGRIGRSV